MVVAVADTGVNPYHETYYRPQHTAHPCTWVEGFDDCSVPALPLSVGQHADYATAVAADKELWDSVKPHQWYWIPRTNIIGAVCAPTNNLNTQTDTDVCILDDHGHGSATSSSIVSEAPDALLLVHDGGPDAVGLATAPVMPDIQSHSWGPPFAPQPLHAAEPVTPGDPHFCGAQPFDPETIFFLASGNDAPFPSILDCARAFPRALTVGGSYPGYWDFGSWMQQDFTSWLCRPAARHDDLRATVNSCGTSFSAPTAAGAAAAALLQIRRHDGYAGRSTTDNVSTSVTQTAFLEALRNAATYNPAAKFDNRPPGYRAIPLAAEAPYLFWGYGWLDSTVSAAIADCALGGPCPTKSPESQTYNEHRQALRSAMTQDALPAEPQDDAGSGRDAGTTPRTSVPVDPGTAYSGALDSYGVSGDAADHYRFAAPAGATINVNGDGIGGCWEVLDPAGSQIAYLCESYEEAVVTLEVSAPVAGEYRLVYDYQAQPRNDYRFSIGVNSPAPPL